MCLSASVPALGRTRHPFAVSGSEEPSQKIEFVFSASPETVKFCALVDSFSKPIDNALFRDPAGYPAITASQTASSLACCSLSFRSIARSPA